MEEDKFVKAGEKVQAAGKKIQQVGCALTLLITLPVVGVLFAGPIGGIIGGAIGLLLFVGMFFVK